MPIQPSTSDGEVVIAAVIRAAAIDGAQIIEENDNPEEKCCLIIWKINAAEQIEAAIDEAGYKLVRK
jgi:hypothetical protein